VIVIVNQSLIKSLSHRIYNFHRFFGHILKIKKSQNPKTQQHIFRMPLWSNSYSVYIRQIDCPSRDRHGRDHMVFRFRTTHANSPYHF